MWLLGVVTVLRGVGAGMIAGVELIALPTRRRVDIVQFARITRAQYRGGGVRAYAGITILGALMTLGLLIAARTGAGSDAQSGAIAVSLVATMFAFVGTGGALRAMRELWGSSDDVAVITRLLNRFDRWGVFSAVWHLVAFAALVVALVVSR